MGYDYDLIKQDIVHVGRILNNNAIHVNNLRDTLDGYVVKIKALTEWKRTIQDKLESHKWIFQAIREDNNRRDKIIYVVTAVGVLASFIFPLVL